MAKKMFNLHHRKPSSIGGSNHPRNTIIVNKFHHAAWHQLFQNKTAHEIADAINPKNCRRFRYASATSAVKSHNHTIGHGTARASSARRRVPSTTQTGERYDLPEM